MFDTEYNVLFAFLTSLIITYVAIPKVIFFWERYKLNDVAETRMSNKRSIPVFGGVAIFSGILCSLLFWSDFENIQFVITSLVIVFFVGILDDLLGLSPYKKIIGQILAILIIIYFGDIRIDNMQGVLGIEHLSDYGATLFTIFVVIVIINAFNLIDGVDGLASGIGIISASCFGILALVMHQYDVAIIAFSLMGALCSFLKYNFPPAKLFMGDTGSLLVGMTLSVLAINLIRTGFVTEEFSFSQHGPILAIVFLAIPLFDSLRVFVLRILKKTDPFSPSRDHIHHILLALGLGHKGVIIILYLGNLLLIGLTYFLLKIDISWGIFLLAIFTYLLFYIPFYLKSKRK